MTYVKTTKALHFGALVLMFAAMVAGCSKSSATVIMKGGNPLDPTSSTKASLFGLSADRLEFTLGSGCEADVNVFAEIQPREAEQRAIFEKPSNTEDRDFAVTGPLSASIHIRGPGTYRIWSTPADNPSLRKFIDIVAKGTCSGPGVPPTEPEPVVDLRANGSNGPITVAPNTDVKIEWFLERCTSANWISGPLTGMVGGNGSQTVRITQDTRFGMTCTGPGGTDTDYVDVNVGTSTPPPVTQLTVTPGSLNLYPSSCPNAGSTTGQLTANMAVTWTSNNTQVASVGTNGVVTGLNPGSTTIMARAADGQERTVTVSVNNCPPTAANLQVNPNTLTFQLGGTGCTATGPLTFVATSNQAITLSGWNSSIVSVSTSSPASGSAVTVTALAAGSTSILVSSGAETRVVHITVNACNMPDLCAGANAVLPELSSKGQSGPFVINAGGSCRWALRSSNHHVVSATPFEGTGPSPTQATLWAINSGGPVTITLVLNQGATNERLIAVKTYTIR